ncbi:PIG-L deacetylase family protein [Nocardioides gilvus]|uniref:PIG-L deacetylase family protein n=1 Tax=Nocardioides gilvus TaxID=1735589 RepID=UPI000D747BD9|nr:PIG-L deacetylase family protein [Nocardioides gilvus]
MIGAKRVLAIGAHTDDIELGCGATLSRLHREGATIATAAFSRAELSRPPGTPEDVMELEYRAAMKTLGIDTINTYCFNKPVRNFGSHRQEILDTLIDLRREFNPDLILTMNSCDTHQDHEVVHAESVRAFRNRNILGYQTPWNSRRLITNFFVEVGRADIEKKILMLKSYRTQHELERPYVQRDSLEASGKFYGLQSGLEFAEAFEVISLVSRESS